MFQQTSLKPNQTSQNVPADPSKTFTPITSDPLFASTTPQINPYIQQKALDLGVNYFSGFKGQRVIVTGASKGIGRYVAKSLLDAGAYVAVVARTKALLDSLTKYYPAQAFSFAFDLSDPDEVNVCFKKIMETFKGELDILIHCVGAYYNKPFEDASIKDWDECMNVNTRSIVHLTSLAAPFLEAAKGNRSVVVLTSDPKEKPMYGEMLFSISKCLALELAANKVRVNAVAVSAVGTNFRVAKEVGITEFENKLFLEHVSELKPLKTEDKLPTPDNVADVILWLASEESSFVTGEIIRVDDGMSLTSAFPKPRSRIG